MKAKPRKKKLNTIQSIILSLTILLVPFLLIILLTYTSVTKYPKNIKPTEEFCLEGNFFLPQLYTISFSTPTNVEIKQKTTIFNKLDIFAKQICIKPRVLLIESSKYTLHLSYLNPLNWEIFDKRMEMTTDNYPRIEKLQFQNEINKGQVLEYQVTYPTDILDYYIQQGDTETGCTKVTSTILCDISSLALKQGNEYELILLSKYNDIIVNRLQTSIVSVRTAVLVEQSNIPNNAILQNPSITEIDTTFNKEILNSSQIALANSLGTSVPYESSVVGNVLKIYPKEKLKQNTIYTLKVNGITGLDGSSMENEYVLQFSIDDGPKITGTNITNGFATSGNIVLTFNQNILTPQNIKSYIKINSATNYSYTIKGNQITLNPDSDLNLCQKYTISLGKGIASNTGLVSSAGTSYTLKTTCKRTVYIGNSVQGRGIYAYYFGSGSKKIVFFGAIHGSEANTKTLMNRWVTELDNNTDRIPTDKTIIIIPTVNPDGIANRSRFNANGVDLNRNFDTPNWVTGTYLQTNFYPSGGGSAPFSEPESQDIRNLLNRENPYLTISYHSAAGYVIPTGSSYAIGKGQAYSQLSGYSYVNPGASGAFTYDITGTFEEWAENNGYNALVIELSSAYVDQFIQNSKAMWKMVEE